MSPTAKKKAAPTKAKPAKASAKASAKPQPKAKEARAAAPASTSDDLINVLVWMKAKKGKEDAMARALDALAAPSRAERGCQAFELYHSQEEPGNIFIHEIWSSEADLANHRLTPHFKFWVGLQGAILESRRRYLAE
jgi:quinol monooxygenase YgiN